MSGGGEKGGRKEREIKKYMFFILYIYIYIYIMYIKP